jgi:site-specific recombinase XerC
VSRNAAAIAHGLKLERAEGRAMTPEQVRAFLDSIRGHRLEAAFVTMLTCGLRLSELLGLVWDSVDTDSRWKAGLSVMASITVAPYRHGRTCSGPTDLSQRRRGWDRP